MSIKGRLSQLERAIGERAVEPRECEDIARRWVREMPCWQLGVLARAEYALSQSPPRDDLGDDGIRMLLLFDLIAGALKRQIEAGVLAEDAPMSGLLRRVADSCELWPEFRELRNLLLQHGDPEAPDSPLRLAAEDPLTFVR